MTQLPDYRGVLLNPGDHVLDSRGSVWTLVETPDSIVSAGQAMFGIEVSFARSRIGRAKTPAAIVRVRSTFKISDLGNIPHDSDPKARRVFYEMMYARVAPANRAALKARRQHVQDLLVERGIGVGRL